MLRLKLRIWPWRLVPVLAAAFAVACASAPLSTTPSSLLVGAASDVQFAFEEIAPLLREEQGINVQFSFAGSGNLARQIENGAPIEVYVAADEEFVSQLQQRDLILPDTRQVYAYGRIALVSSRAAGVQLNSLQDLLQSNVKHIAIANPEVAPYGRAARQALQKAGIWDRVLAKVVYGENVRQALQFVQSGDAEAGIVALSLATIPEVTYILVDEKLYDPLRQTLAVVRGARNEAAARVFISFLTGTRGSAIMKKYGFGLPPGR